MNTTEFKAGQRWRVIDASGFNEGVGGDYSKVRDGDLLIAIERNCIGSGIWKMRIVNSSSVTLADYMDIHDKRIVLSEDTPEAPTEASGDVSELPRSEALEGAESVSQGSTDSPSSKDILWHIISRAERYNGHSQFTVSEMDLGTLITLTRMLDDYVTEFCELRLSWGGDHMGYYTADIYEIASARDDSEDKILMQVEKVTGVS